MPQGHLFMHSPIYVLCIKIALLIGLSICRYSNGDNDWHPDKKRLYEFIVRSFLAACSKPAVGFETTVRIAVADEGFHAQGEFSSSYV